MFHLGGYQSRIRTSDRTFEIARHLPLNYPRSFILNRPRARLAHFADMGHLQRQIQELKLPSSFHNETFLQQILCFFTLRRITAFEHIPFCRFRLQDNTTSKTKKNPSMIDEYLGAEYECAYESFCPDPCCHGVHSSSELFSSRQCALNKCVTCVQAEFNDDFAAMRKNRWNITCPCGRGLMYRADVETCVHADLCSDESRC
ncbi:unnamed protein product, partial [Haemonchus placei]